MARLGASPALPALPVLQHPPERPPLGVRVRITSDCDIRVIIGRIATVVGYHVDGVAVLVEMADTGARFLLEPSHIAAIDVGHPPYIPSGDAQPARVRGTAT